MLSTRMVRHVAIAGRQLVPQVAVWTPVLSALRTGAPAMRLQARPLCSSEGNLPSTEELFENYSEARDLLEDAEEGRNTVYFESDLEEAREAVEQVMADYAKLLEVLPEKESSDLRTTAGLKMEELRSRLGTLVDSLIHDED